VNFLLLGLDSLIAGVAVGPIVVGRWRLPLAVFFGLADAAAFLIGATLTWHITDDVASTLKTGIVVALGLYLLGVSIFTQRAAARWPVWVLPFALCLDNLTFGLIGDDNASGSLFGQAGVQALSSAMLALVGLLVGVVLPRVLPSMQRRAVANGVSGGALIVGAGLMLLAG
jgi:hypothetical protein